MIIDDGMREAVEDRVEALFPDWMNEDQRWAVFQATLAAEPARQREAAVHALVLIEVMSQLYPGLDQAHWRKFGWNDVLSGKLSAEDFVHKVRMAKAAGSRTGKL